MKLNELYRGDTEPFEGDRQIWLRNLPANARVTRALVTLESSNEFEESIAFTNGKGDLGATKVTGSNFIEVDFHARRTLAGITGNNINDATVQIDMGGTYIDINQRGTIKSPEEPPFSLASNDEKIPSLTLSKFKLSTTNSEANITSVTIRSVPSNINVRLGQLPAFWTRLGELTTEASSPDFTNILNIFLQTATVENGFYIIPFIIHSDTLARLNLRVEIDYVLTQQVLPPHLSEATLQYNFNTLPNGNENLLSVKLPETAIPIAGKNNALIRGEFKPTRIAKGSIGEINKTLPKLVSPDSSLAQPFESDKEIAVTAIDILFTKTQPSLAGVNLAIQSDEDGKPSGEVLSNAEVILGKPLPPNDSIWGSATLANPFRVLPNTRYWLVLQSQVGQAFWQTQPSLDEPGLQSRDGNGIAWRSVTQFGEISQLAALFRLRNQPEGFTIPVQLQIGRGENAVIRKLDEFAPLGRVEFQFDFTEKLSEHLEKLAQSNTENCGQGNLLINPDFRNPPVDDATFKLFNLEEFQLQKNYYYEAFRFTSRTIFQTIDLSVERYIVLSIGSNKPVRIDCAGANPARTTLSEIVAAINNAMQLDIATLYNNSFILSLTAPSSTALPQLRLYLWFSTKIPTGWQAVPESILRLKAANDTNRLATLLIDPAIFRQLDLDLYFLPINSLNSNLIPDTLRLSGRVACHAGCSYLFQFIYGIFTSDTVNISPPKWETVWLNQQDEIIRTDEEIFALDYFIEEQRNQIFSNFYEIKLTAPKDAFFAEIRFLQAPPGGLWIEKVVFAPTQETLNNPNFTLKQDTELLYWQLESGLFTSTTDGIILSGDSLDDTVLTQVVEVAAKENYELQIHAVAKQIARLELRWLSQDLKSKSTPIVLLFDKADFPTRNLFVTVPETATQLEIRLIQPKEKGDLSVKFISLRRSNSQNIPLILLSEAPGELTISNLSVTYDIAEPEELLSPPKTTIFKLPSQNFSPPTPPPPSSPSLASKSTNFFSTQPESVFSDIDDPFNFSFGSTIGEEPKKVEFKDAEKTIDKSTHNLTQKSTDLSEIIDSVASAIKVYLHRESNGVVIKLASSNGNISIN